MFACVCVFVCLCVCECYECQSCCVYTCRSDCNGSVYSKSPKTLKRLPNIHFLSEVDQNQINSFLTPLLQSYEFFFTPGR